MNHQEIIDKLRAAHEALDGALSDMDPAVPQNGVDDKIGEVLDRLGECIDALVRVRRKI